MSAQPPPQPPPPQGYGQPPFDPQAAGGQQQQPGQYPPQQGYGQQQQPPFNPAYGQQPPPPGASPNPQQQQQYGYGAPSPPGQYGAPPLQQGQYGAPPPNQYGGYPQQGYAPPQGPGGYPAPPSGYPQPGYPQQGPPQGYPQQGGYPQGPPQGYGGYGAPPAQGYGAPGYGGPPPQQFQGVPPPPRNYLGVPVHPSENPLLPAQEKVSESTSVDGYDNATVQRDVEAIKKATKGFGTNEAALGNVMLPLSSLRLPVLRAAYKARHGTELLHLLEKELRGKLETVYLLLARGPLHGDVYKIHHACKGLGTNEAVLTEIIFSIPPHSLTLLKASFQAVLGHNFDAEILAELSMKTKSVFTIALNGEWKDLPDGGKNEMALGGGTIGGFGGGGYGQPVQGAGNPQMVEEDLATINKALKTNHMGEVECDIVQFCSVIFARSPAHLHALQRRYLETKRKPLTRVFKSGGTTGHILHAVLFVLDGAKKDTTGIYRDAKYLHKAMAGMGTNDNILILRLIRAHWDKPRFKQIQMVYQTKRGKSLTQAIVSETSGDYRDALMSICGQV